MSLINLQTCAALAELPDQQESEVAVVPHVDTQVPEIELLPNGVKDRLAAQGISEEHLALVESIQQGSASFDELKTRATNSVRAIYQVAHDTLLSAKITGFFLWYTMGLIIFGMREVFKHHAGDETWLSEHTAWKETFFNEYGLRTLQYAEEMALAGPGILDYSHLGVRNALEMKWPLKDYFEDADTGQGSAMSRVVSVLEDIKTDPYFNDMRHQAEEDSTVAKRIADTACTYLMLQRHEIGVNGVTLDHARRISDAFKQTLTKRQIVKIAGLLNSGDPAQSKMERLNAWVGNGCRLPNRAVGQRNKPNRLYDHLAKIRVWKREQNLNDAATVHQLFNVHPDQIEDIDTVYEILGELKRLKDAQITTDTGTAPAREEAA